MALRLPLAAGGAVLGATGSVIHWALARYMRAPLGNTGVLALVTLTALAGSNALYFQSQQHPSPLFAPMVAEAPSPDVVPVVPAPRRLSAVPEPADAAEVVTGSVEPRAAVPSPPPAPPPLGNAEVLEIQRKLAELRFYTGALDGLYGPRTAAAIRAFETANGLTPKGELTLEVLEAVRTLGSPAPASAGSEAVVTPASTPADDPDVTFAPIPDQPSVVTELAPLTPPRPLAETLTEPEAAAQATTTAPEAVAETAVTAIGESVESIITGVQTMAMTTPPTASPDAARPDPAPQTTGGLGTQDVAAIQPLDTDATPEEIAPFSAVDPATIAKVQRGLASLGFLHGPADGVFGEATARAIRNFEVYYSYSATGEITPGLVDLLVRYGAAI